MDDRTLISQRVQMDDRRFMITSLDPVKAPRIAPAMRAVRSLLADQQWHRWDALMAAALRESDLAVKTIANLLGQADRAGVIERRGVYERATKTKPAADSRAFRLKDWPQESGS